MAYIKTDWENSPSIDTPISADNLNKIETGLFDQDARITTAEGDIDNLQNVTKHIVATAGSNGDFKINITNALATGDVYYITFPSATTSTSNARLSIDNGVTYKNIKNILNIQLVALDVQSKNVQVYYNGTDFIYSQNSNIGKMIYHTSAGGSTQTIANITVATITNWNAVTLNDFASTGEITYSSGIFTINSANISKIQVTWQPFWNAAENFFTYLVKNGNTFIQTTPTGTIFRDLTTFTIPVVKGDQIYINTYLTTGPGTLQADPNNLVNIIVIA